MQRQYIITHQWWYNLTTNFGDTLAPIIVNGVLQKGISRARDRSDQATLISLGSILHMGDYFPNALFWGTGYEPAYGRVNRQDLNILAVRGPATKRALSLKCDVFGDPAILMPFLFPRAIERSADSKALCVPHQSNPHLPSNCDSISPLQPWEEVLAAILRARIVFCESLHAAILAQVYGVPWVWWLGKHGRKARFKWHDWFESICVQPKAFTPSRLVAAERWAASIQPKLPDATALRQSLVEQVLVT